jgi:crossover junction endodeoxyribonuclease RuvC
MNMIMGIDIGVDGAVAILGEDGVLAALHDMPCLADGAKNRRTINAALLHVILREIPVDHAYVEYVGARPGEGAVGAFAFGRCRGIVEGVLGSLRIPTTFITPPCWKRAVGLPCGTNKDASRSMAIARWPQHAEWFKRKMDNGRSDAALIAVGGLVRAGKLK